MKTFLVGALIVLLNISIIFGEIKWVGMMGNGGFPADAFRVGGTTGDVLYVCRANIGKFLIPGKLHPSQGGCFIAENGEKKTLSYDVAVGTGKWVKYEDFIPERAVAGGHNEVNGPPYFAILLYVCRTEFRGFLISGKFHVESNKCWVSHGGSEFGTQACEILVHV